MIAPDMATLLAYVLTDANVSRPALRRALQAGLPQSFNSIVVDGDMSTNDTVLLLANGMAVHRQVTPASKSFSAFTAAVVRVMRALARMIVKDGEGATRLIDIIVRGARTRRDAERVADTIARHRSARPPSTGVIPTPAYCLRGRLQRGAVRSRQDRRLCRRCADRAAWRRSGTPCRTACGPRRRRSGVHAHHRSARRLRDRPAHGQRSHPRLRAVQFRVPHIGGGAAAGEISPRSLA